MELPWPLFTLPLAGIVRAVDAASLPLATVLPGNVLHTPPPTLPPGAPGGRIILWSGWMGGDDSRPGEGYFPPDFRTWSTPGRKRFDDFCDAMAPALEARSLILLFRPHARHVLSDPQSCVSFLAARKGQPFAVVLDPAGFITSSMLPRAEDHLARAFEALGAHPGAAALALTNLEAVGNPDPLSGPELRSAPLSQGLLSPAILAELASKHWPAGRPLLLLDPAADSAVLAPTLR